MKILNELLGENAIEIWVAGMFWALIGIVAVKVYYLDSKKKFSIKYWLKDNSIDVMKGIIWSLILIRLGDVAIQLFKTKFGYDLPETTDFVAFMILISGFIQVRLHKYRNKKENL